MSALIKIKQTCFNDTDNHQSSKRGIHALFIDFSKAFDPLDQSLLLTNLKNMNINKTLWLWIMSFLSERTQQVKLLGLFSSIKRCTADVPQRSVISPVLYNIFIGEIEIAIPDDLRERVCVCKYCTVYERVQANAESSMQRVLDNLQSLAVSNSMHLYSKKTKDMWILFSKSACVPNPLRIDSKIIERVPVFKLLGVWHQNDLRWNHHFMGTMQKANKRLIFLRECRKASLSKEVGISLYCS